jgi:hypothetical protein
MQIYLRAGDEGAGDQPWRAGATLSAFRTRDLYRLSCFMLTALRIPANTADGAHFHCAQESANGQCPKIDLLYSQAEIAAETSRWPWSREGSGSTTISFSPRRNWTKMPWSNTRAI